jgi:hypothetical protein
VRQFLVFIIFLIFYQNSFAQKKQNLKVKDTIQKRIIINPLAPSKAAFYSAILPGLGQAYNKKYWKIPVVYGAMGTSLYVYSMRNSQYNDYRNAYKLRLQGNIDEYAYYSDSQLINAMTSVKKDRDLMMMVTVALYALNIVDAVVDAHLKDFNVNEKLTFSPTIISNDLYNTNTVGLALSFNF